MEIKSKLFDYLREREERGKFTNFVDFGCVLIASAAICGMVLLVIYNFVK